MQGFPSMCNAAHLIHILFHCTRLHTSSVNDLDLYSDLQLLQWCDNYCFVFNFIDVKGVRCCHLVLLYILHIWCMVFPIPSVINHVIWVHVPQYLIKLHCIVSHQEGVVILSSGHKHADLFPCLPYGGITICYHIQVPDRLIFVCSYISLKKRPFIWTHDFSGSFMLSGSVPVLMALLLSVELHYLRWVGLSPL